MAALSAGRPAWGGAYEDFFLAIAQNDPAAVRKLLVQGVSPNSADRKHGAAIVYAARLKSWDAMKALLDSPATDTNASAGGETALMLCSQAGELGLVRLLVSKGAQVNKPGWTPLHYAVMGSQRSVAEFLIERNAYIDAASENGTTPLMLAAREANRDMAELLIREGADPSLRNEANLSAADYFRRRGAEADAAWMQRQADEFLARYGTKQQPVPARPRP